MSWGEVEACWSLEKKRAFQPDNVRPEHDEWEKPQTISLGEMIK